MTSSALIDEVAAVLGPAARRRVPLAPLCTYRVGGPAELFVTIDRADQLEEVAAALGRAGARPLLPSGGSTGDGRTGSPEAGEIEILVLGRGSNLLVADAGFAGLVVQLGEPFATVELDIATGRMTLGGAALLPVAARRSAAGGLRGFEWAVGVPGSAGGALRMNAGGHGSDMAASVRRARLFDLLTGRALTWGPPELGFGYRRSALHPHQVAIAVELELDEGDRATSEAEIAEIVRWRRAHQPGGQNAGSVFTNPPGRSAGRLIDEAGLKGLRVGTAEVSTKHANFIQADPGGSADDVHRLIALIRHRIWEHAGVALHCENLLIGFTEPLPVPGAGGPVPDGSEQPT